MIIVIFGVSGAGKTTMGKMLAEQLGWRFLQADDYHPAANIEKMRNGHPLTTADATVRRSSPNLKLEP